MPETGPPILQGTLKKLKNAGPSGPAGNLIHCARSVRIRFGEFVVDASARQLLRGDTVVHLSPKAFDLLLALVTERPRVLTKAELHERLWPSVFVSDGSLAMVVTEVRAALGESAQYPVFVRTVHRHGYAFQGDARVDGAPEAATLEYWVSVGGRDVPLQLGDNVVGRDPRARVWLDSPSVSRQHARIRVGHESVTVEDLGSKNGTHLGDAQLTSERPLRDGDVVRFGSVSVTFRAWKAEPTRTEGGAC